MVHILLCVVGSSLNPVGIDHRSLSSVGGCIPAPRPRSAAATQEGPEIGSQIQALKVELFDGGTFSLETSMRKPVLMVFARPNCPACDTLLPGIAKLRRTEKNHVEVVLVTSADRVKKSWNNGAPLVRSRELFEILKIRTTPYGVIVDTEGIVRAKGIVNNIEHLESLVNALETGYATLDDKRNEERQAHESMEEIIAKPG